MLSAACEILHGLLILTEIYFFLSFVDILFEQNTVSDKTVLFIVDSMIVGFPT